MVRRYTLKVLCMLGVWAALAATGAPAAQATDDVWTNSATGTGAYNWSVTGNWSLGTLPDTITGDFTVFSSSATTATGTINLGGPQKIYIAEFTNTAGSYTIAAGNTLTIKGIYQYGAGTNTILANLVGWGVPTGNRLTVSNTAGTMTLAGQIGTATTATELSVSVAGGLLAFTNTATGTAANSVTGTIVMTGSGVLTAVNGNLGTAGITFNGGKIALSSTGSAPANFTNAVTVNLNSTFTPTVDVAGAVTLGSTTAPTTFTNGSTLNVTGAAGSSLYLPSILLPNSGTATLNVGTPTVSVSKFSGAGTFIKDGAGTLVIEKTDAPVASPPASFSLAGGTLAVVYGGAYDPLGGASITTTGTSAGQTLFLSSKSATATVASPITAGTNLTITTGSNTQTASGTVASATVTLAGPVTMTGAAGSNTLTANTLAGYTLILSQAVSGGVLQIQGAGSLKPMGVNGLTTGDLSIAAGSTVDLGGFNQTVGNLTGAGTLKSTGPGTAVLTTVATTPLATFSGVLQDGGPGQLLGFTKNGSGTLELPGNNQIQYTGPTVVGEGTLKISGQVGSATATAVMNTTVLSGAKLQFTNKAGGAAANNLGGAISVNAGGEASAVPGSLGTSVVNLVGGKLTLTGQSPGGIVNNYGAGLVGTYYQNFTGTNVPASGGKISFAGMTPSNTAIDAQLNFPQVSATTEFHTGMTGYMTNWAVNWQGYIKLSDTTAANYTFILESDDGSIVEVNGAQVVAHDGTHPMDPATVGASVIEPAGYLPINVGFFQAGGNQAMILSYTVNGSTSAVIPASDYYHLISTTTVGPNTYYGNAVNVFGTTAEIATAGSANLGKLTLANGAALTVTASAAGQLTFTGLKLNGGTANAITSPIDIYTGSLDVQGIAGTTLTKLGAGNLILDQAAVNTAPNTKIVIGDTGRLIAVGGAFDPLAGAAIETASGVTFSSTTSAATFTSPMTFTGNASLTAGKTSTGTAAGATITVTGPITITDSNTLTLNTTDNYTMVLASAIQGGSVSLQGGSIKLASSGVLPAGTLTVDSATAIDFGATAQTVGPMVLASGTLLGSGTLAATSFEVRTGQINVGLAGTGDLTKTTSGTVVLGGPGSFTGSTYINQGVLSIRNNTSLGTTDMPVTVLYGAALELQGNLTVAGKALSIGGGGVPDASNNPTGALRSRSGTSVWTGNVTLNDDTYIGVDAGSLALTGDIGAGGSYGANLYKVGAGTLKLTGNLNYYDTVNFSNGNTTISNGALASSNPLPGNLVLNGGVYEGSGAFNPALGTGVGQVQWTNNGGGFSAAGGKMTVLIDNGGSPLFSGGSMFVSGTSTSHLIFGSTTADSEIEFQNPIDFAGTNFLVTVNDNPASAGDFATLSGLLSNGTLTKNGAGLLVVSNANNSFLGVTTVSAGTLKMGAATAIPQFSDVLIAAGATFDLGGFDFKANTLSSTGTVTQSGTGTHKLYLGASTNSTGTSFNFAGTLADGGPGAVLALEKDGTGTVGITGANAVHYTGLTDVRGGVLQFAGQVGTASTSAVMTATVTTGATLQFTYSASGSLANNFGGTLTANGGQITGINGNLGAAAITLAGSGKLALTGGSLFANTVTTSGNGTIDVTNNVAVAAIAFMPGSTLNVTATNSGSTLAFAATKFTSTGSAGLVNAVNVSAGQLTGGVTGTVVKSGTGDYIFDQTGSANTGAGLTVNVNQGRMVVVGSSDTTLGSFDPMGGAKANINTGGSLVLSSKTAASTIADSFTFLDNSTLIAQQAASGTAAAAVTATGTLTVAAGKTLSLSTGSNYSLILGGPVVSSSNAVVGGTIKLGAANVFAPASVLTVSGGTLDTQTFADTVSSLVLNGGSVVGNSAMTATSSFDLRQGTISAPLTGSIAPIKTTTGTVVLNGSNSFLGRTQVQTGVLVVQSAAALGATGSANDTLIAAGATLALQGGVTLNGEQFSVSGTGFNGAGAIRSVSGSNVISATSTIAMTGNTYFGVDADALTIYGSIVGTGNLSKVGLGTLFLYGNNTYTGATYVLGGSLIGNVSHNSNLQFNNGGVLETLGAFTESTGTAAGQVQWVGSGGFSANGGPLAVTLNNNTNTLVWGTNYFVPNGSSLVLGSAYSTDQVDFRNGIDLAGGNRTVQVGDNPNTSNDQALLSGAIINGALTKTGPGTLVLAPSGTAVNTFAGGLTMAGGAVSIASDSVLGAVPATPTTNLTFSGGALRLTSATTIASNRSMLIKNGGGTIDTAGVNSVFGGTITGIGPFIKAGAGELALTSTTNSAMGPVVVAGGILSQAALPASSSLLLAGGLYETTSSGTIARGVGAGSGQVSWMDGGFAAKGGKLTISLSNGGTLAWGTMANFLANGATMTLGSSTADSEVSIANTLDLGGQTRVLTVNDNAGTSADFASVTGQIINGTLLKAGPGKLVLAPSGAAANAFNAVINSGSIQLGNNLGFGAGSVTVNSGAFFDLNGQTTGNLTGLTLNSASVTSSGTGASMLNLGGDITASGSSTIAASGLTFAAASHNITVASAYDTLTITSAISSGAYGFTKSGAGVLALSGSNSFGGSTTLAGGTLRLGSNNALGTSSLVLAGSGATLIADGGARSLANAVTVNADFTVGGSNALTLTGPMTLSQPMTNITLTNTADTTFTSLGGTGGFAKGGLGRLILNGTSTYSGPTIIASGTVLSGGATALSPNSDMTVLGGAQLDLGGFAANIGALNGPGSLTSSGTGNASLTLGQNNDSGIFTGNIYKTGTSALLPITKVGTGTQVMSGVDYYQTTVTISAGALDALAISSIGSTGSTVAVNSGGSLEIQNNFVTGSRLLTLTGSGAGNGGALRSLNTTNTWGGPVTLTGDAFIGVDSGQLLVSGQISGIFALTKVGGGTLVLSNITNSSVLNPLTAINVNAGALKLGASGVIPDGAAVNVNSVFDMAGFSETIAQLGGASTGIVQTGGGALTVSLPTATSAGTFLGSISGPGSLVKAGPGSQTLGGVSTFTGPLTVQGGTLAMGTAGVLSGTPTLEVDTGASFMLGGTSQTVANLTGAGQVSLGGGQLAIGMGGGSGTFSGSLTGSGGFSKIAAGSEILTGSSPGMTGSVSVRGGTLALNGAGALTAATNATVFSGATFKLDNSTANVANRFNDTGILTLAGGTFLFQGAAGTTSSETIGQLVISSGGATFDAEHGAGGSSIVSFTGTPGLTRQLGGTVAFTGTDLGTAANKVLFNTDPSVNGILAYATVGNDFATYDSALGIMAFANYTNDTNLNLGQTINLKLAAGAATAGASQINSLNMNGFGLTLNDTLTLTSGGLIVPVGTASVISGTGALTTSSGSDIIANVFGNLTMASTITGSGVALTKSGSGVMTVSNSGNNYGAGTYIVGGTLALGANEVIPDSATAATTITGATLDTNSHSETLGALTLNSATIISSSGAGTVRLNPGLAAGSGITATGTNRISNTTMDLNGATARGINVAGLADLLTVDSPIINTTGTAGYTKNGAGTLVLNGDSSTSPNNYAVTLAAGTLALGNNNALGGTAGALIITGGTIQAAGGAKVINNPVTLGGSFTVGGTDALTLAGPMTGASGTTVLTANNTTNVTTLAGSITGTGLSFAKTGPGTVLLSSAGNNYGGGYTGVLGGTLRTGANEVIPDSSSVEIGYGATLDLAGNTETINTLRGVGSVALGSSSLSALMVGAGNGSDTFYGVISGSGGLIKVGTGTQTLFAASTYTGPTTVNSGTLAFGTNNVLPSGGAVRLNGGVIDMAGQMQTVGALALAGGSINNVGLLTLTQDVTSPSGSSGINGGAVALGGGRTFNVTGTLAVASKLTGAGASLIKTGSGLMTLAGTLDDYTGGTFVNGGTLKLAANNVLPDFAVSISSATLDRGGMNDTVGPLSIASGTITGAGTLALAGDVTSVGATSSIGGGILNLNAASRTFNVTDTLTIADKLTGLGYGLTKSGTGTMVLTASGSAGSDYSGPTIVATGALKVGAAGGLSPNSSLTLSSGASLDLAGTTATAGALNGTGTVTSSLSGTAGLTVGQNNDSGTFSGVMTPGNATVMSLTKVGTGTQTLAGVNNLNGQTVVSGGILNITNSGALGVSGSALVNSGGTLQVSGGVTFSGQSLTLNGLGFNSFGAFRSASGTNLWTGPITLSYTDATAPSASIDVDADVLIVSGVIGGTPMNAATQGLVKVGDGTLVLSAQNTYGGITAVNAGTLKLAAGNALPAATSLTVNSILDGSGYDLSVNSLGGSGLVSMGGGTLTLGTAGGSDTFSGILANNSGGLVKNGAGLQTLAGLTLYDGPTVVNGGTLSFAGATGSFTGTGGIAVKNGGALEVHEGAAYLAAMQAGTFGGGSITVEKGGRLSSYLTTTSGSADINESLTFLSTGTGASTLVVTNTSTVAAPVYRFNNVTLNDGANLYVSATNAVRLTTNITGTSTVTGNLGFQNITGNGTINIGAVASDASIYGTVGSTPGPVVLNVTGGTVHFMDGSHVAANTLINDLGGGTIDIQAGQTGTASTGLSSGTITLAGGAILKTDIDLSATATGPGPSAGNINTITTLVNVTGTQGADLESGNGSTVTGSNPSGTVVAGTVAYKNVHVQPSSSLTLGAQNGTWNLADVYLDGSATGTYFFAPNAYSGNAKINSLHATKGQTVAVTGGYAWGLDFALDATNTINLQWNNTAAAQLNPGFALNGNTFTQNQGWTEVNTDPGTGTILTTTGSSAGTATSSTGVTFLNYDPTGTTGWGAATKYVLGGQSALRGTAISTTGVLNTNKILSMVDVKNTNPGDFDAYLQAGLPTGSAFSPGGTSAVEFTNVHLEDGSNLRLQSFNNVLLTSDIYLDGNATLSTLGGADQTIFVRNVTNTSATARTLTVSNTTGGALQMDGLLGANANVTLDSTKGTIRFMPGFSLGGRTVTILGSGDTPVQLWDGFNPGAGTLVVAGNSTPTGTAPITYNNGLEIRSGSTGTSALTAATNISVANGQRVSGYVASGTAMTIQNIAATLTITASGSATAGAPDAILTSTQAATNSTGTVAGLVKFINVATQSNAVLALSANPTDMSSVQLGGTGAGALRLQGNLTLVNSYTGTLPGGDTRVVLGDITDLTASKTSVLTLIGTTPWHVASTLTLGQLLIGADTVNIDAGAVLNLTSAKGVEVLNNGQLYVNTATGSTKYTVDTGGTLHLASAGFNGSVAQQASSTVVLDNSQVNYTASSSGVVLIGVPNYAGTLTINNPTTVTIGGTGTNPSIISPIAGTATNLVFNGGDAPLTIGALGLATSVIGGSRSLTLDANMAFMSTNTFTGGTAIRNTDVQASDRKVAVYADSALGTGAITLAQPSTLNLGGNPQGSVTLEVRSTGTAGLTAKSVTINPYTQLDLYNPNLAAGVVFQGGSIRSFSPSTTVTGTLADTGGITFAPMSASSLVPATLTFTKGLALTDDPTWNVQSGIVTFTGAISGSHKITKTGDGILKLSGANTFNQLHIVAGSGWGGSVVVLGASSAPASVSIDDGTAYTVMAADYQYSEINLGQSYGVLALGANNNKAMAFSNGAMSLGAVQNASVTYSGAITAAINGGFPVYHFGGGGGVLTVTSSLIDADNPYDVGTVPTDVQIGTSAHGLNTVSNQGQVILSGTNSMTGSINIYMAASFTNTAAYASAGAVNLYTGGMLDLGSLPAPTNLVMLGGGLARTGGVLSIQDLSSVTGDYILGAESGTSTVADGALANPSSNLIKIGDSTLVLATPSGSQSTNSYATTNSAPQTWVQAGVLDIPNFTSLGGSTNLLVSGTSTAMLDVVAGSPSTFSGTITLDGTATLYVATGKTASATGGLVLASGTANGIITGGGTFSTLGKTIQSPVGTDAGGNITYGTLTVTGSSTLTTVYGVPEATNTLGGYMSPSPFIVNGGSTLNFATIAAPTNSYLLSGQTNHQKIGTLRPGSTVEFGTMPAGYNHINVYGADALVLGVDPAVFATSGTAAFSSPTNPYTIKVDGTTRIDLIGVDASGAFAATAVTGTDGAVYNPVSYIAKTGTGELRSYSTFNPTSTDLRLNYWIVQGGLLNASGTNLLDTGLGANAYAYSSNPGSTALSNQHLVGIDVQSGGTLAWSGPQGFYGSGAAGFNAFTLRDGSTLQSSASNSIPLTLGLTDTAGTPYLCYPTVTGNAAGAAAVTLAGNINLRSGLVASAGTTSVTINIPTGSGNNIQFSNDLTGGKGFSAVSTVNINPQATLTYRTGATTLPVINNTLGNLVFDPGAGKAINFNTSTVNLKDGLLRAATGTTNLSSTFIAATPSGSIGKQVAFAENFDDAVQVLIDGVTVLAPDYAYNTPSASGSIKLTAGWHTFEAFFINQGGNAGPAASAAWPTTMGFGYAMQSALTTASTTSTPYSIPSNTIAAGLFRTTVNGSTVAGLTQTMFTNQATIDPTLTPSGTVVTQGTDQAQIQGLSAGFGTSGWNLNTTYLYSGQIFIPTDTSAASNNRIQVDGGATLAIGGFSGVSEVQVNGVLTVGQMSSADHIIVSGTGTDGVLQGSNAASVTATNGIWLGPTTGSGKGTLSVPVGQTWTVTAQLRNNGAGSGTLVVDGGGTLVLTPSATALNNYSGGTNVVNGTLVQGAANALPVGSILTLTGSTASFDVNGLSTTFDTSTGLMLTGTGNLINSATTSALLTFAPTATSSFGGAITPGGTNAVAVTISGGASGVQIFSGATSGIFTTTVASGTLDLQNGAALGTSSSGSVIVATGATLQLDNNITINGKPLTLSGTLANASGTNTWAGDFTANAKSNIYGNGGVLNLTGNVTASPSSNVIANSGVLNIAGNFTAYSNTNITAGGGVLNLAGNITAADGTLILTANGSALNVSGTLAFGTSTGGPALIKQGSGTAMMSGAQSATFTTTVAAGKLDLRNGAALGSSGSVLVTTGAALQLENNISVSAKPVMLYGLLENVSGSNTWNGNVNVVDNLSTGNFIVDSGMLTLAGGITSSSGLGFTKSGPGVLNFAAPMSYTGKTYIFQGTLRLGVGNALPAISAVDFTGPGSALDLNGLASATVTVLGEPTSTSGFSTNGLVTSSAPGNVVLVINEPATNYTYGGLIDTGAATTLSLVKQNAGTQALAGANTFNGTVTVQGGVLRIENAQALGNNPAAGASVLGGATLEILPVGTSTGYDVAAKPLSLAGTGYSGAGAFLSTSGTNIWRGSVTLTGNATIAVTAGQLTIGSVTGTDVLTKTGLGELIMTGSSSNFTGDTVINAGIILQGNAYALSNQSNLNLAAAGTMDLGGYDGGSGALKGAGTLTSTKTGVTTTLTIGANNATGTFAGTITQVAGATMNVTKTGTGTETLTGPNGFTGTVNVNAGALAVSNSLGLGSSPAAVNVLSGATLDLLGGISITGKPLTLAGSGNTPGYGALRNLSGNNVWGGNVNVSTPATVGVDAGVMTFTGTLTNSSTFTKFGPGSLVIAGPQSHAVGASMAVTGGSVTMQTDAGGAAGNTNLALNVNNGSVLNLAATQHLAQLNLTGGSVVNFTIGSSGILTANGISINDTSKFDLTTGAMILNYTTTSELTSIKNWITSGFNNGTWTGNGLTSSTLAAAVAAKNYKMALGYLDNGTSAHPLTSFDGVTLDSGHKQVLVRYTWAGDVNLDGVVNDDDVTLMLASYNKGSNFNWSQGDVAGYNGLVNDDDVTLLIQNYNKGSLPNAQPSLVLQQLMDVSGVPEPATLLLLGMGGLAALLRRRAGRTK